MNRLAALLQIAVRDEKAEAQEFAVGRDSVSRPVSRSSPAQQEADGDWDSGKEAYRIAILPDELSDDEDNASSHMLDNLSFAGGFGVAGLPDSPLPAAVPVGVSGVPEESALSRLMNRKGGINAAAAAVLSKASSGEAFVYPDVPLIRLILKMMANLLGASNSSVAYSEDFRGELANWLLEVDVGPADSAENRVKLKRIAKKDQIVMFYFNSITQY